MHFGFRVSVLALGFSRIVWAGFTRAIFKKSSSVAACGKIVSRSSAVHGSLMQ